VDLAGSERLTATQLHQLKDQGRLREAKSINRSLSALGDVFLALLARQTLHDKHRSKVNSGAGAGAGAGSSSTCPESSHIPYRNSKLTFVLQVRWM